MFGGCTVPMSSTSISVSGILASMRRNLHERSITCKEPSVDRPPGAISGSRSIRSLSRGKPIRGVASLVASRCPRIVGYAEVGDGVGIAGKGGVEHDLD